MKANRTEQEVNDILDTFMMVYAFGLNLDTSNLKDMQKAKAHLESSHSGWPQLQAFAQDVKNRVHSGRDFNFAMLLHLAEEIGRSYSQWQGRDCRRAKDELSVKTSYRDGRVQYSQFQPNHTPGRRSVFTDSADQLQKMGVFASGSDTEKQVLIPNYINSQSMCLS